MCKNKNLFLLFCFVVILAAGALSVGAEDCTYYVSNNGSDNANGSSEASAWQTISRLNQQTLYPGETVCFKRGDTWRLPTDDYPDIKSGDPSGYITYTSYGSGPFPSFLGSLEKNDPSDWMLTSTANVWTNANFLFPASVGNIIFNNEESTGRMKRGGGILEQQGDYRVDSSPGTVLLYSASNPASYYSDLEFALRTYMFNVSGKSYVQISNLDLRYGSGHGIWGSNGAHHIVISDNKLSYIGGAMMNSSTRYGNAIEMWSSTHDIYVERNQIRQVYDAALTSQGSGTNQMYNHYYQYNVIWDVRYCFEYWNRDLSSITDNIYFENNTCVNSGNGFGENRGGSDLTFYNNTAQTTNLFARNNIFYNPVGTSFGIADHPDQPWNGIDNVVVDYNVYYKPVDAQYPSLIYYPPCWWEPQGRWLECITYTMDEFTDYQAASGKDVHSIVADPLFVDEVNSDFRPVEGSPACTASISGSYAGALPCASIVNDFDNDGIPDNWEIQYGLDPYDPADANYDNDNDNRTNLEEYVQGTNPTLYDNNCQDPPVRIADQGYYYYNSLQDAYDLYISGEVRVQATTFVEDLSINRSQSFKIQGGYGCQFSAIAGRTVLGGALEVTTGSLEISSGPFAIEQ